MVHKMALPLHPGVYLLNRDFYLHMIKRPTLKCHTLLQLRYAPHNSSHLKKCKYDMQ